MNKTVVGMVYETVSHLTLATKDLLLRREKFSHIGRRSHGTGGSRRGDRDSADAGVGGGASDRGSARRSGGLAVGSHDAASGACYEAWAGAPATTAYRLARGGGGCKESTTGSISKRHDGGARPSEVVEAAATCWACLGLVADDPTTPTTTPRDGV
jgi:hypothetical protein